MARRAKKWGDEVVSLFCEILVDPENSSADALEISRLERTANIEVFNEIKKVFGVVGKIWFWSTWQQNGNILAKMQIEW